MYTLLQTPTNDLRQSLDFYQRLQFQVLSEANPTLVTDGKALIEINEPVLRAPKILRLWPIHLSLSPSLWPLSFQGPLRRFLHGPGPRRFVMKVAGSQMDRLLKSE